MPKTGVSPTKIRRYPPMTTERIGKLVLPAEHET
jgi:hypothetical protein